MTDTTRQRCLKRLSALKTERSSWDSHWRELADYILPRRSRFFSSDRNKGTKRNEKIINSTPIIAARTCGAGMMSGITSPARPWFRLTMPDPELGEFGPVRAWLHACEERMREVFARSNIYNCFAQLYVDLPVLGTSPLFVDEDAHDVIRGYVLPVGQYSLATSHRGEVNTVYREVSMTVAQVAKAFDIKRCSASVRQKYEQGHLDQWVDLVHIIEPNTDCQPGRMGPKGQAVRSCWMEAGGQQTDGEDYLKTAGYEEFPVMAPRWAVLGEDVYGSSPGMDALGDAKALQLLERRKAQVIDKIVNPPMVGPTSLRNQRASLLPGDVTYVDAVSAQTAFRPAIEVNPSAIPAVAAEIREHERRIDTTFYKDLFLMLAESDRREITAREVAERHEEKMLQLGPVLERLQDELLDPLIDRTFEAMRRRGMLPPAPEEIQGQDIKVEYISVMAQAQKLLGTAAVERLASFTGNLAGVRPEVLDKINWDGVVAEYAGMLGVKPDLLLPEDAVQTIRQQRAKQAQAAQMAQMAQVAADGAKTLSETDMQGDTALNRLVGALGVGGGSR